MRFVISVFNLKEIWTNKIFLKKITYIPVKVSQTICVGYCVTMAISIPFYLCHGESRHTHQQLLYKTKKKDI